MEIQHRDTLDKVFFRYYTDDILFNYFLRKNVAILDKIHLDVNDKIIDLTEEEEEVSLPSKPKVIRGPLED